MEFAVSDFCHAGCEVVRKSLGISTCSSILKAHTSWLTPVEGRLNVLHRISFEIAEYHLQRELLTVEPCIDGTPLTKLIEEFEISNGYTDPAGVYGGLIPCYLDCRRPLEQYFCEPTTETGTNNAGKIAVLGCGCGEVGCWPLLTSITSVERGYRWAGFGQPHRPKRKYDAFGPFEFERIQYEEAVREAAFRSQPNR